MSEQRKIVGPFHQLVTFRGLSLRGPLRNEQLEIISNAGMIIQGGHIQEVGDYEKLVKEVDQVIELEGPCVGLPGWIDSHTHICFAGSRHLDYSARNSGDSYLEIAERGGGIWDTVQKTRIADFEHLYKLTRDRLDIQLKCGVTTVECKSGYGLNHEQELKQLRIIKRLGEERSGDIIATCLAAHMTPRDFEGKPEDYLDSILTELLPVISKEGLAQRVDIFTEKSAFSVEQSRAYLTEAAKLGFQLTVHGDQFSPGGGLLAVETNASSVDHLENTTSETIRALGSSNTVATVLPGASLGLGMKFAPSRQLLDAGAIVNIASDWNPGSAPMGDLLTQAAIMGASEKLTDAEVLAGITFRAAAALRLNDRGRLIQGSVADFNVFNVDDYREILYHQGQLKPQTVWKKGQIFGKDG
ncbi:imidazolonepropionase [Portibacter marinus]|uniref:imidazolonepropionase n=1 Tax=Portibacter marinus TaxID=2898660 RepID=UPI001F36B585|nr:imidazolonepropionase [Portibacter marinus]